MTSTAHALRQRPPAGSSEDLTTAAASEDDKSIVSELKNLSSVQNSIREEILLLEQSFSSRCGGIHDASLPAESDTELDDDTWWLNLKDESTTVTGLTQPSTTASPFGDESTLQCQLYDPISPERLLNEFIESPYSNCMSLSLSVLLLSLQVHSGRNTSILRESLLAKINATVLELNWCWIGVPILGSVLESSESSALLVFLNDRVGRTLRNDPTVFEIEDIEE